MTEIEIRQLNNQLIQIRKDEERQQVENTKIVAEDLFRYASKGWFLMCGGCKDVALFGNESEKKREETSLGASQNGWKVLSGDVYCPKCR